MLQNNFTRGLFEKKCSGPKTEPWSTPVLKEVVAKKGAYFDKLCSDKKNPN